MFALSVPDDWKHTGGVRMRSQLEEKVFAMYKDKQLWGNQHCLDCREAVDPGNEKMEGPVSIWHCGEHFLSESDPYRILFVGKTAVDCPSETQVDGVFDVTGWADEAIMGDNSRAQRSAYWVYTRAIISNIYNNLDLDAAWERIAFTNLLKCNTSTTQDTSPGAMKDYCLRKLGVFAAELRVLRPRTIVIYSGGQYDEYLGEALFGEGWRDDPDSGREHKIQCGAKSLRWWSGSVVSGELAGCRVLRTDHPERKKKAEYVNFVADWIRTSVSLRVLSHVVRAA
jgi:hypothetical protein